MRTLIEIGGELKMEHLGSLYDLLCLHDCWLLGATHERNERGHTSLGPQRMLGDPTFGPEDEELLKPCSLADFVTYCVQLCRQKEMLSLAADGERFSDDEVSGALQTLGVDYCLQLPMDEANNCCALTIRPGTKAPTYINAEPFGTLLYTANEIRDMLDNKEKAHALLNYHELATKPLKLI